MKFHIHEQAHDEAVGGAIYFNSKQSGLGEIFTSQVLQAFEQIEEAPRLFAKLESTTLEGEIRRVILKRFSYLVIYEIQPDLIEVLAVTHASREPDYWAERRGEE